MTDCCLPSVLQQSGHNVVSLVVYSFSSVLRPCVRSVVSAANTPPASAIHITPPPFLSCCDTPKSRVAASLIPPR